MINQSEPYADSPQGSVLLTLIQLITPILLVIVIILQLFSKSNVTVNPANATVNVQVTPENNFNPSITHNITVTPIINMTGFGNWTGYNSTFGNQTNYFGNYTINVTNINNTIQNYTYNNFTLNNNTWLFNVTPLTYLCNVTDVNTNLTYKTWCWT